MLAHLNIWEDLLPSVIRNCWGNTGLCSGSVDLTAASCAVDSERQAAVMSWINRVVTAYAHLDVVRLLNPERESECVEKKLRSKLWWSVSFHQESWNKRSILMIIHSFVLFLLSNLLLWHWFKACVKRMARTVICAPNLLLYSDLLD